MKTKQPGCKALISLNLRSFKLLKIGAELAFHLENVIALTAFFAFEIIAVNKSSYHYSR